MAHRNSGYDLIATVLSALRVRSGGTWTLPAAHQRALTAELARAFFDPALPQEQVVQLLKLIAVFERDEHYRGIPDRLIEILRAIPAAVARLAVFVGRAIEDPMRRNWLRDFEASTERKVAPHVDRRAEGCKLAELFAPVDVAVMRVRSASRTRQRRR